MTDRVVVTAVDALDEVLAALAQVVAPHGWHVVVPDDAAHLQRRAREAVAGLRLPHPLVVRIDAGAEAGPVDIAELLRRTPVAGVVADEPRGRASARRVGGAPAHDADEGLDEGRRRR